MLDTSEAMKFVRKIFRKQKTKMLRRRTKVAGVEMYASTDGLLTMKREGELMKWTLRKDGVEIDSDRYRHDIAERHDLELM